MKVLGDSYLCLAMTETHGFGAGFMETVEGSGPGVPCVDLFRGAP